jgi:type II secretory pathway component PulK
MKIFRCAPSSMLRSRRRRGSSVLVILVLLACMAMLITANTSALHVLKQELKRIDKQQQKKFGQPAGR